MFNRAPLLRVPVSEIIHPSETMTLLTIEEKDLPVSPFKRRFSGHPVWQLGFRPFYLLAAGFAVVSIPLWLSSYFGKAPEFLHLGLYWHMHEMVFGFVLAVIIGFLYTAGRNWTGLPTPHGTHLMALAALWLAGRLAMLLAPAALAAVVDVSFLPLAAWPLYRVLRRAGNKRNLFLVGLLAALTLLNISFHAMAMEWLAGSPAAIVQAAILVVVMIESVIGARVIPNFTANAVPGAKPVVHARRDAITVALTAAAGLGWASGLPGPATAGLAIAAASAQLLRIAGWMPHRTLKNPLLWILHVSYMWIPVGFILLACASLQLVSASAAFHALTVGSMGGLIIGMITRTALGHTGRRLAAGGEELIMYLLVQAGAVLRLLAALQPELREPALIWSGVCWSFAFLLYAVTYAPYLLARRIDGREG